MVLEAVKSHAPCAPEALAELCGRYWQPLYTFARRRGHSPEDAQDLVQGFFEHLIRQPRVGHRGPLQREDFVRFCSPPSRTSWRPKPGWRARKNVAGAPS